jgi:hypothetical protein
MSSHSERLSSLISDLDDIRVADVERWRVSGGVDELLSPICFENQDGG